MIARVDSNSALPQHGHSTLPPTQVARELRSDVKKRARVAEAPQALKLYPPSERAGRSEVPPMGWATRGLEAVYAQPPQEFRTFERGQRRTFYGVVCGLDAAAHVGGPSPSSPKAVTRGSPSGRRNSMRAWARLRAGEKMFCW